MGYDIDYIQDETVNADLSPAEYGGVICNAFFKHNDIKKFTNLKFIQLTSAGYDRVPMDYIKEYNIEVFNAGSVYSTPIAEWVVLKILEIYKDSRGFYNKQHNHQWEKNRELIELNGKTACIIGVGNIGREVTKRLKPFNVNIIGIDKIVVKCSYMDEYHDISELERILPQCDMIILSLPLSDETHHMINGDIIKLMKNSAVLINISRGSIIDEQALIGALKQGKFRGIALDVFEEEPLSDISPLWDIKRVIITPHNAFISHNNEERLLKLIYTNLELMVNNINYL